MSVTPDFIGQRYKNNTLDSIWKANSTTPGDWSIDVQSMNMLWAPTTTKLWEYFGFTCSGDLGVTSLTINHATSLNGYTFYGTTTLQDLTFPNLVSVDPGGSIGGPFSVGTCSGLTSILLPELTEVGSYFAITNCDDLTTLSIPKFATVVLNDFTIEGNDVLTTLSAPFLATVGGDVQVNDNAALTSISLAALSTVNKVFCKNNPALTTFTAPSWLPISFVDFSGCALTQATVDYILAKCVANATLTGKTINLNGGTNSAPSASGLADKAILEARVPANTVAVNP